MYCDRSNFGAGPKRDLSTSPQMDDDGLWKNDTEYIHSVERLEGPAENPTMVGA